MPSEPAAPHWRSCGRWSPTTGRARPGAWLRCVCASVFIRAPPLSANSAPRGGGTPPHSALGAAAIEASGGTLDKYMGDAVMAFWGAPDDQPDHAERACRAALEIMRAVVADNRARKARGLAPVRLRIGVHSGAAIVGNIGAPGRVNYTLIGDTVNVANRLEAYGKEESAGEGGAAILMSAATRAQLGPTWQVANLGEHPMRGRAGKIGVFRLVAEK